MKYVGIVCVILLVGCSFKIDRLDAPKDLIPKEKMTKILTELLKIESHALAEYIQPNRYFKLMINSGDSLLNAHGVKKDVFDASFTYYGSRQDDMREIYEEALERLTKELDEIQAVTQEKED